MTIATPMLPRANVPFIDDTGHVARPWYLYLMNLELLSGDDSNVNDLAVQQAFDNDNTSQVAELQAEIDALGSSEADPFIPNAPQPLPLWWTQAGVIYAAQSLSIATDNQALFSWQLINRGNIFNNGVLAVI